MRTNYVGSVVTGLIGLISGVDPTFAQNWTLTSAPQDSWASIASSADGTKLVAVSYDQSSSYPFVQGAIYTSTNSGATWVLRRFGDEGWSAVASSADGTKLVVANVTWDGTLYNNTIYTSGDSGTTWMSTSAPNSPDGSWLWSSVASSADGVKLVAVPNNGSWIYTSTNAGASWNSNAVPSIPSLSWSSVASSADGAKLVAMAANNGNGFTTNAIYISANSGTTWTQMAAPSPLPGGQWSSVASSADGIKLVASWRRGRGSGGGIYVSTNSGATWEQTSAPNGYWGSVASSADGSKLMAASSGGQGVYISQDSGTTWTATTPTIGGPVASSADGSQLVAAGFGGFNRYAIFRLQSTPAPLLSLTSSASNALISWTIPSLDFTLQQNSDLTTTNWTDVPTPPVLNLTNLQNQVIVSPTNGNAFYRLKH